ncbi:MAG: PIN domain-containing protein [Chloroflexi bacterium]|nr:PIN domain-containing protein [Chloroflexota bacterium]
MNQKLLLVDFENVHQVDLAHLDESFSVIIFVGLVQKTIPVELVMSAQKLGSRVEWQRVEGNGSNALDFYIACHLGRVLEKSPTQHCVVLSKDKGFDPLLRHLNKNGLKCKRINSLLELEPESTAAEEPNYKRVLDQLGKTEKKLRPRKRTTLSTYISFMFQNNIPQADVDRIIDIFFANKLISEANNRITYEF